MDQTRKSQEPVAGLSIQETLIEQSSDKTDLNLLAGSIVLGCLLVAASIIYASNQITKQFSGANLSSSAALGNQPVVVPQVGNNNPPANTGDTATVTARNDQPVLGKSGAKVTIVEFGDFQCPFCQKLFQESFQELKSKYVDTGKAKIVFRHFPLPFHQNAQKAAEAAECANRQGKFWQYHDLLYTNSKGDGTGLAMDDLKKYADSLGLNKGTLGFNQNGFNQCLDSGATATVVAKDISDGNAVGVNGTPTLFINGKRVVGAQPTSAFAQVIDQALKQKF